MACVCQSLLHKEGRRDVSTGDDLHQRENEDVLDYLSRASAIRLKLESYGDTTDDRTMSAHIARHLSDTYERVRDSLLLDVSLSSRKLEEVLRTASHEKQRSGRWSCLLYTSPSPRDLSTSRMPSSA